MKKSNQKSNILTKIYNVVAWLVLIATLVIVCAAVLSSYTDSSNGKEIFGIRLFVVQTDSMSKSDLSQNEEIFFNAGDVVISSTDFNKNALKEGDVITFISNNNDDSYGKTITHKIRKVKYTTSGTLIGYETYGINTGVSDEATVQPHTIVGKYVGKIPYVGKLFTFMKTQHGFFISIVIPSVLIIIYFSVHIGKVLGRKEVLDHLGLDEDILD